MSQKVIIFFPIFRVNFDDRIFCRVFSLRKINDSFIISFFIDPSPYKNLISHSYIKTYVLSFSSLFFFFFFSLFFFSFRREQYPPALSPEIADKARKLFDVPLSWDANGLPWSSPGIL